jgi:putative hydrolase of the HAD superfamily
VLDDVADPSDCFEALFATFAQPAAWTFDPGWPRVSEYVRQRGLRQIVASNFDQRLHGLIRAMPRAERIERVIVSSEVGWRKPAPEFFAHAIETLRLAAGDILFVGDGRANDYEPAVAAGMQALLIESAQSLDKVLQLLPS